MNTSHEPTDQGVLNHWNPKNWADTQRSGDCRLVGVDSAVLLLVHLELVLQEVDQIDRRRGSLVQLIPSAKLGPIPEPQSIAVLSVLHPARLKSLESPSGQFSNFWPPIPESFPATNLIFPPLLLVGKHSDSATSTTVFHEIGSLTGDCVASLSTLGTHKALVLHRVMAMKLEFLEHW